MYVFGDKPYDVLEKYRVYELDTPVLIKSKEEALAEGREIYKHFHNKYPQQYPLEVDNMDEGYILDACASVYNGTVTEEGIMSKFNPQGLYQDYRQGGDYEFILDSGEWQADRMSMQNIDWSVTPEPDVWIIDGQVYSSETANFKDAIKQLTDDTLVTAFELTV